MTDHEFDQETPAEKAAEEASNAVVRAMNDLPILARLEFVKNIIFDRGGSRGQDTQEEVLIIAADVLGGVIEDLKANHTVAQLRSPQP
jgi:hypothetical protein